MSEKNPIPVRVPQQQSRGPAERHFRINGDDFVQREAIAYLTRVKAGLERSRRQD